MKSNLSTKALLESKLGSRVEESLPKKKKKEKGKKKEQEKQEEQRRLPNQEAEGQKDVAVDVYARDSERPQPSAQGEQQ